jgi:hypothetical protein
MVALLRSSFFYAISAGCAVSVLAESVAAPLPVKTSKKSETAEQKAIEKKKSSPKNKSVSEKKHIAAKISKNGNSTHESAKKTPAKPAKCDFESEADHKFRKDLILRLNELILKTQKASPATSAGFTEEKKLKLLKSFTAALGDGVQYAPALDFKPLKSSSEDRKKKKYYKSIIIATGKVLYLRIDAFNNKNLKGLRSDYASVAELDDKPLGVVIDLRSADGIDYDIMSKTLDLFIRNGKRLKVPSSVNNAFFEIPIILLVDGKTSGAAEVFAAAVVKAGRGICLGEPTAGVPFKKKKIMLANGDYLLIPVIPKKFAKFATSSLKPDIRFPAKPQISYELLKNGGDAESSDKCVARAVELLICLNAISKK